MAACATSALWSLFQKTAKIFQHSIPSPVEITKIDTDMAKQCDLEYLGQRMNEEFGVKTIRYVKG